MEGRRVPPSIDLALFLMARNEFSRERLERKLRGEKL